MGGRGVRVLHISDLHMRSVEGPQAERARLEAASRWRVIGKSWKDNLAELCKDETPFDLVVFTGDLGDQGHPTDYSRAVAFLKQTCDALGVPLERLFVVPGNHDIDRKRQVAAWRWMRSNIGNDPRVYSEWMAGSGSRELRRNARRDLILERQQAFWGAVTADLGRPELDPSRSPHARLGYRQTVTLPGLSQPIHVIGFDTAWLAGDDHDAGQLWLTEHQVALLTTTEGGEPLPGFRLALMHHRLADLADGGDSRRLLADHVDLLLHGHQHEPAADVLQGPDHQLLVLATGCLYDGDEAHRHPNACQVIDLTLDQRARPQGAAVRFRGWATRSLFWGDDALLYRRARDGSLRLHYGQRRWRFDEDGDERREHVTGREAPPSRPSRPELIDFTTERQRHRRFVEREDVLAQLDQWLLGPGDAGWVVVTGGPGMGKSAILSAWVARREAAGAAVPHHFVRRQVANWDDPDAIAASLAVQIEATFPELRDPEAGPESRLIELLARVSKHLGASQHSGTAWRLVVVVDGLDETRAELDDNPLPRFLPHVVPAGIRLLCAMRPTYPHLSWIEARSPARRVDLDGKQWAASNEAVVHGFWKTAAAEYEPPLSLDMIATAIARAEGNVLHAVMLHDALQGIPAQERHVDRVPRGLEGLLGEIWDRAALHKGVRAALGLLCAAQEALSLDLIADLAGWGPDEYAEKVRFVREARQLLLEEPGARAGVKAYRPRHDWVREFVAGQLGAPTMRAHHGTLSQKLATWPAPVDATARRYALRHALIHRAETGDWESAWRIAADTRFVETKCRELGVDEMEADVTRLAERCRTDVVFGPGFNGLARALTRESHWLRAAPEATAALLWNRLRRFGWNVEDIDRELRYPAEAMFVRARHVAARESPVLVRDLIGHSGFVRACAVTPDGRYVVSASDDKTLKVWDLATGRALATLADHSHFVLACAVTPDGRRVVSASWDKTLRIWDLDTGNVLATLVGHSHPVRACAVTSDGRVVSASDDKTLRIWDADTGRTLLTLHGHSGKVRACAVTRDGRRVVSASEDKTLKVWDLETGESIATLSGHSRPVLACAVTPAGRVVSASEDKTLKVWDLETGESIATLAGHSNLVNACAVTPDGRWVISASLDLTLRVWDLHTGQVLATLEGHADLVRACAVTPDGRRVVSASDDKILKVWDLDPERARTVLEGHTNWVRACAATSDGRHVVSASDDHTLKLWDTGTGHARATLKGHAGWVLACAVTVDDRHVVSASTDQRLKIWDLETGAVLATLEGHDGWVRACAMTPDGQRVITASHDKTLKVWDLGARRELVTLEGHADWVLACAVTRDGRRLVSASEDKTLKVWDLETGRELATLKGHADSVRACAITGDGRVVSASEDRTLKVWDLRTGRELVTLEGHADSVRGCAITADGQRVISASDDRTLKVWDLETYACLFTHRGDAGYIAVAATSTTLVAGDASGALWFLDWPFSNRRTNRSRSDGNNESPRPRSPKQKHIILFLAANPSETGRLALDEEARAIEVELERSGFRDCFELVTRWAVRPLDLLRELRRLRPTVVHFSGHGGSSVAGQRSPGSEPRRGGVDDLGAHGGAQRHGLFFQGAGGRAMFVSAEAIERAFGAAGRSVKLVVLNACYSPVQADALLAHVDCVVGMSGSIHDDSARSFAVGFYGGLGECESVAASYAQGRAAISLEGLRDSDLPQLRVRDGVDPDQLVLAVDLPASTD